MLGDVVCRARVRLKAYCHRRVTLRLGAGKVLDAGSRHRHLHRDEQLDQSRTLRRGPRCRDLAFPAGLYSATVCNCRQHRRGVRPVVHQRRSGRRHRLCGVSDTRCPGFPEVVANRPTLCVMRRRLCRNSLRGTFRMCLFRRYACWFYIVVLAASCSRQNSAPLVALAGYRLGATWQTTGRSLPCQSQPPSGLDQLALRYRYSPLARAKDARWCSPSDSVILLFAADTLVDITVRIRKSSDAPELTWRASLSPMLLAVLGAPDSVTTRVDPLGWRDLVSGEARTGSCRTCVPEAPWRTLEAYWNPRHDRHWEAEVTVSGTDSLPSAFGLLSSSPLIRSYAGRPAQYDGFISLTACGVGRERPCPRQP